MSHWEGSRCIADVTTSLARRIILNLRKGRSMLSGDSSLDVVLACLVVFLAIYLLGPPILIYNIQRFKQQPTLLRFDLDETPPPGAAGRYFRSQDRQFTALGFERLDSMTLPDAVPNVKALLVMYCHRRTLDLALVTMMYGLNPQSKTVNVQSSYVEILSRFKDGNLELIQTNNVQMLGSFPESSLTRTYRFPQVDKVERLFELHCKLLERDHPAGKKFIRLDEEFDGDCVAYLQQVFSETYEKQIGTGYLCHSPESEDYRPTVKGALLMTWRELWPFKQVLWEGVRASAKRLERELS